MKRESEGQKEKGKPPRLTCHDLSRPVPSLDPNLAASTVLLLPPPTASPLLLPASRLLLSPGLPAATPHSAVRRASFAAQSSLDAGIGFGTSVVQRRRRRRGRTALVTTTWKVPAESREGYSSHLRSCQFSSSWYLLTPMATPSAKKGTSVYLYIPNLIGYLRIIMNFIAFAVCYSNRRLFAVLYFFSFFCDGLDGWFARKFNQASTFGAVLDMVTDRVSTACLLALLSQFYRPGLVFILLLGLDITSHWFQMYSSFLSGKTSHKDVKHTGNGLLKLYYGYRPFMAFCCVASEVLYIILFLFADEKNTSLLNVCRGILKENPLIVFMFISTLIGWALKQVINVIQMKTAADACVVYDLKREK